MRTLILALATLVLCIAGAFAAVMALSRPSAPPPMPRMEAAGLVIRDWFPAMSPTVFLTARDGTPLAYRFYQGRPDGGVAVIVHGSTGFSASMDGVARALKDKGLTVYSIDLRGHGDSGTLGDIAYRGQLEDDMSDLLALIAQRHPKEKRLLLGHSLGGAFALRIAAGPLANQFDAYVATSPFLAVDETVSRPNSGGWADAAVPRIIALALLNTIGISAFDGLPAIAYAVPPNAPGKRASIYSYRLLANMSLPRDWRAALGRIQRPAAILIGSDDELFQANAYATQVQSANPRISVEVLPGAEHMGPTVQPAALDRVAATMVQLRDAAPAR